MNATVKQERALVLESIEDLEAKAASIERAGKQSGGEFHGLCNRQAARYRAAAKAFKDEATQQFLRGELTEPL